MAGLVYACVVPHPPIMVPEVGRGREQEISATLDAMQQLHGDLAAVQPETLFVISPHGPSQPSAMGVATSEESAGDLSMWGATGLDYRFDNDIAAVQALRKEAEAAKVPLVSIGQRSYELDHGVLAPMYFLADAVPRARLVPLTFCWLSLREHFRYGGVLRRAAEGSGKRVALIASGDLSHRLTHDAPYGYEPMGRVFDERVVEAVSRLDSEAILSIDNETRELAGECGLRSIAILMGALEGLDVRPEVLSYEGPFGVGYMVAAFYLQEGSREAEAAAEGAALQTAETEPEREREAEAAPSPLVRLARLTVEGYVRSGALPQLPPIEGVLAERAGVFVSIKKRGQLRGCIGTFEPTQENVAHEVVQNAIRSATEDPRFEPIREEELGELSYSVDVLTSPEPVESVGQLDPKRYGLIVEGPYGRRGLLLPDLEGVETAEQQMAICCAKAGLLRSDDLKLYRFEVERYT